MSRSLPILWSMLILAACGGCKTAGQAKGEVADESRFDHEEEEELTPQEKELNSLWRQGYGFNNPNPQREKQGLPPEDFFKAP